MDALKCLAQFADQTHKHVVNGPNLPATDATPRLARHLDCGCSTSLDWTIFKETASIGTIRSKHLTNATPKSCLHCRLSSCPRLSLWMRPTLPPCCAICANCEQVNSPPHDFGACCPIAHRGGQHALLRRATSGCQSHAWGSARHLRHSFAHVDSHALDSYFHVLLGFLLAPARALLLCASCPFISTSSTIARARRIFGRINLLLTGNNGSLPLVKELQILHVD